MITIDHVAEMQWGISDYCFVVFYTKITLQSNVKGVRINLKTSLFTENSSDDEIEESSLSCFSLVAQFPSCLTTHVKAYLI